MNHLSLSDVRARFVTQQCLQSRVQTVPEAAERMLGVRGAEGSTPYLSLFWRVDGFRPEHFDDAVHRDRQLLRIRGPRGTYYWVTIGQARLFLAAFRPENLEALLTPWGMTETEYLLVREAVQGLLSAGDLLSLQMLKQRIPQQVHRTVSRKGAPPSSTLHVALEAMLLLGEVTALKEPGFHRHRTDEYWGDKRDVTRPNLYGLVSTLYPSLDTRTLDSREARRSLLRAYIRSYGPVALEDMAWWTGWTKTAVRQLLTELQSELAEVRIADFPGPFWVMADQTDAYDQEFPGPTGAHLLPGGDSSMKGYSFFQRFLPGPGVDHNVLRFSPAVLVNGIGQGNWGYRLGAGGVEIAIALFDMSDQTDHTALEAAGQRVGSFLAESGQPVRVHISQRDGAWAPTEEFP